MSRKEKVDIFWLGCGFGTKAKKPIVRRARGASLGARHGARVLRAQARGALRAEHAVVRGVVWWLTNGTQR